MKTFRITEILEWVEDERLIAGDASREGWEEVEACIAKERMDKQNILGKVKGLPFECEADSLDEAIDLLNGRLFEYDYLKVNNVDYETVELEEF